MDSLPFTRRLPVGAEVVSGRGVHVRLWAPIRNAVDAVLDDGRSTALAAEPGGYLPGLLPHAGDGTRYPFRPAAGDPPFPPPAAPFPTHRPHPPPHSAVP